MSKFSSIHRTAFGLLLAVAVYIRTCESCTVDTCPTWFYRHAKDDPCICGASIGTIVFCNNETQEVTVLGSHCLTSINWHDDCITTVVVGRCIFALNHGKKVPGTGGYVKVSPNTSEQDHQTCDYLNRQGRLCGNCKREHYASAYSYDLKCYQCPTSRLSSLITYLAFLIVVMVFRISVTSPRLATPVLFCQMLALPVHLRFLIQMTRNTRSQIFIKIMATLYGIWNLDFFRTLVPPICLHYTTMQIIALDYLVAVYPLVLLVCFYVLLTAHDRGWRPIMWLWRPFRWCTVRMRQRWNLRHSIIDAFATFLLLSYMKLLNTSNDLLLPTNIFNTHGICLGNFLYYDATIEYWGPQHMPYACLAIIVFLVGILLPLALLLLYPMQWFQRCLNRCRLNRQALHIFMQCFYRTDGGRECRYFAALYPSFRIATFLAYSLCKSAMFFPAMILLLIIVLVAIALVKPYRKPFEFHNRLDALLMLALVGYTTGFVAASLDFDRDQVSPMVYYGISATLTLTPLVYFIVCLLRLSKRALIEAWSTCPPLCDYNRPPAIDHRQSYEDLSTSEELHLSVN